MLRFIDIKPYLLRYDDADDGRVPEWLQSAFKKRLPPKKRK